MADQAKEILRVAPNLKVIVAHMGRRWPNTSDGVEGNLLELQDEPNVYFETSTVRDSEIMERAVEVLGEDRLVFGSDYPSPQ